MSTSPLLAPALLSALGAAGIVFAAPASAEPVDDAVESAASALPGGIDAASQPGEAGEASAVTPDPAAQDAEPPARTPVATAIPLTTPESPVETTPTARPADSAAEVEVADTDPWGVDLPDWLELDAEYRARTLYINPLEINDTNVRAIDWTEHRLRLDLALKRGGWLTVRTRMDLLDGVLWGDNGRYGEDPSPSTGVSLASRRPNNTRLGVELRPGEDPLDPSSYGPRLQSAEPLQIDHVYADAVLPFGILRVGRQPASYGASLGGHEGTRLNRWGVSSYGDTADRFLFGTKLDEAVRMIRGGGGEIDPSLDNGVILVSWLDIYNNGDLFRAGDNLRQNGLMLSWARREAQLGDIPVRNFALTVAGVHLGNDNYETKVWALPFIARAQIGDVSVEANFSYIHGQTRELAEGLAVLNPNPAQVQQLRAKGARALVDWAVGDAVLSMEFDYAQGDPDPRQSTPITSYSFPRDLNVGLLMFEHIIAYESARRAEVGIHNLEGLDAPSFPLTEASTETRLTNAIVLFPQAQYVWVENDEHRFHTRVGVLAAWPASPDGAVDPVLTSLSEDGLEIRDDARNYHGGDPGNYYGTEFDLQLQWLYRNGFAWTVEAAALKPGSSLRDANGDAVPSFFLENRFEFLF